MALPHRVVGLICELGRAESEGKTFQDGSATVPVEEDRHQLRWHEHICTGNKSDIFERHPETPHKGNHHYFANFPKQLLLVVQGTLDGGSEPYDVTTDTKRVTCAFDEDPQDDLPSWMTVWLEPAECVIDYLVYTYDFESIDEGHPEDWNSSNGTTPETYNEDSARAEAQALFDLYCAELRDSLQPLQSTSMYLEQGIGNEEPVYPRWKNETEYEDPEVMPYEPQACPTQTAFICPWYKSMVELSDFPEGGGYEGFTTHTRIWYDFSFQINRPEWGPWRITDGTGIVHPEETFTGSYTYTVWYFSQYVVSQPPDEGDYANLPNYPPYWADTDGDGEDDTYYVPSGYSETYTEYYTYTIPEWTEYKTYEFDYPFDTRSNYDVKSRWKIKCDYRPDPTCCGPAGKQITFGIKIYRANLKSAVPPYEDLGQQSPTTQYRNCKLKGYGHGRSGDRGFTAGRGIHYFENHNCPFPNELGSMHWAYYGTMVRPIFTTSEFESVVYVTKTIGEEWTDAYDIEIPSFDGKVTYIKDFWIESITNA
jgi:hypothetical protein